MVVCVASCLVLVKIYLWILSLYVYMNTKRSRQKAHATLDKKLRASIAVAPGFFDSKIQGHTLPVFIPRFFAERNMNIYGGRYNNEDVSLTICTTPEPLLVM